MNETEIMLRNEKNWNEHKLIILIYSAILHPSKMSSFLMENMQHPMHAPFIFLQVIEHVCIFKTQNGSI